MILNDDFKTALLCMWEGHGNHCPFNEKSKDFIKNQRKTAIEETKCLYIL